ncbi:MAG: Cof-type HAD-IIB family hydrolase [Bacteroidales bacterium]|nr:Cof-type HAD-IIB family hydrolase [Bacteroidales bacterium]
MIKAAFFDIDGTLLSFRTHRVSEGTVRAFDTLHRHGIHTFISSGRPLVLIPKMPVTFEGYITMNGGLVFLNDTATPANTLISHPIPTADQQAWLDYAANNSICTMLFSRDAMMGSQVNDIAMRLREQLEFKMPPIVDIDEMRHHEAYQLIAIMPPDCDAEVARLMPDCRLPRWTPVFTDIVAAGNSKAIGMEAICRHYGIRQEETLAFGDGGNDIEMLEWAGIGVAMGNAEEEVKKHADIVTTSVDDEGIEHAINQLFQ